MGRYRFAHGLVRETIYENISKARRVRLHARVGQALSGMHRDDPEHVLEIARHAWAAVPVAGAGAALPQVLAAADQAMVGLAFEQAEQQLRRALELLGSMPPSAERSRRELGVQVRLGNLLSQLLSPGAPEARSAFGRAGELAAEVADDPAALPALAGVHRGLITQAELGRARALAERMLDGTRRSKNQQALLAGHYFLGQTLFLQGELVAAREHLEEAVRLAAAMPDAAWLPGFPLDLGAAGFLEFALVLLGLTEDADRVAEAAGARLERTHPYSRALVMGAALFAAVCRRNPTLVQTRAEAAAALAERWGFRMLAAAAAAPLGWVQAIQGDPAGGTARLREALATWEAVGLRASQPLLLGLLAEAEQLAGGRSRRCAGWRTPWPRSTGAVNATSWPSCIGSGARACSRSHRRGWTRPRPPSPPRSTWPDASAPSCWRTGPPPAWPSSGPRGRLRARGSASRGRSRPARRRPWRRP